jgi:hypothetical protein
MHIDASSMHASCLSLRSCHAQPVDIQALIRLLRRRRELAGDALGDELRRRLEPTVSQIPSRRALGAKITDLRNDRERVYTWWNRRPEFRRALAAALGVEPMSLAQGAERPPSTVYRFDELPDLEPLDLRKENPCPLGFDWPIRWREEPAVWFQAPPGAGSSLVARWIAVRTGLPLLVVESLEEVQGRAGSLGQSVLLIDVARVSVEDQPHADALAKRGNIVVFARSPPPGRAQRERGSPLRIIRSDGMPVFAVSPPEPNDGWIVRRWRPADDWRGRFIDWVYQRLERAGTKPPWQPGDLTGVLDRFDPAGERFDTPGAVLWLLSLLRRRARPEGLVESLARGEFVDDALELLLERTTRMTPSNRRELVPSLVALAERLALASLADTTRRWDATLARPTDDDGLAVGAKRPTITYFRGLLRAVGGERFQLGPNWVVRTLASRALSNALLADDALERVALGGTIDRRSIVDDALDALLEPQLRSLLNRLLASPDDEQFVTVAATEALYAALGRRFEKRQWKSGQSLPNQLLLRVVRCWKRSRTRAQRREQLSELDPCPMTRAGAACAFDDGNAWIADGWSWSLRSGLAAPDEVPRLPWLFPGWFSPRVVDLSTLAARVSEPNWPTYDVGAQRVDRAWESSGFMRLVRLAPEVLDRLADPMSLATAGAVASVLLPALLADATWRERLGGRSQVCDAFELNGVGALVADALGRLGVSARQAAAEWLWSAAEAMMPTDSSTATIDAKNRSVFAVTQQLRSNDGSPLLRFCVATLPDDRLDVSFETYGPGELASVGESILRGQLARAWVRWKTKHGGDGVFDVLSACGSEIGEDAATALARRALVMDVGDIWRLAPHVAFRCARELVALEQGSAWFHHAPEQHYPRLIELIDVAGLNRPPSWVEPWFRYLVRVCPELTRRAFEGWSMLRVQDD